jgi:hypothetical protein
MREVTNPEPPDNFIFEQNPMEQNPPDIEAEMEEVFAENIGAVAEIIEVEVENIEVEAENTEVEAEGIEAGCQCHSHPKVYILPVIIEELKKWNGNQLTHSMFIFGLSPQFSIFLVVMYYLHVLNSLKMLKIN